MGVAPTPARLGGRRFIRPIHPSAPSEPSPQPPSQCPITRIQDSSDAYEGLAKRFGEALLLTRRNCSSERCDFRDCDALRYSLVDMMNLARTRLILGSGYSSYSEVAARMGGTWGRSLPILMAGKDFGETILDTPATKPRPKWQQGQRARGQARRRRWKS